jgi:hypothetical protein
MVALLLPVLLLLAVVVLLVLLLVLVLELVAVELPRALTVARLPPRWNCTID